MLRQEGLDAAGFILGSLTGWYEKYALASESRVTEEQKRRGWEMFVRTEKILVKVLHAALKQQAEEAMDALSDGPEGFYG